MPDNRTIILTHRGLEPARPGFFAESSLEAFTNHLNRGYGIEFDINFTRDNKIIIFHDSDLSRITDGKNKISFSELTGEGCGKIRLSGGNRLCFLDELFKIIAVSSAPINALHLKGKFQEKKYLDILSNYLLNAKDALKKLIIFDVMPKTGDYLKNKMPELLLAPSVAHPFDIARYNKYVQGTLISIEDAVLYKNLYVWAWLDEWDLDDSGGKKKKFYTKKIFNKLQNSNYKIALVTPELHGNSPSLLGGEAHPDAKSSRLSKRLKEIIGLNPDVVCTDFPEKITQILNYRPKIQN